LKVVQSVVSGKWDTFLLATHHGFSRQKPGKTNRKEGILRVAALIIITDHNNMGGGHHHVTPGSEPRKDQDIQAIKDAKIPLAWRDTCSHILIGLNKCRRETWWNPNKCEHERHIYEECEYNAYLQRVEAKVQQDKVKAAQSD